MKLPKQQRNRGYILTPEGLKKLQEAIKEAQYQKNKRYTLEVTSECTGLSTDTVMKVLGGEAKVDKSTLKDFFIAFHLKLEQNDFYQPQADFLVEDAIIEPVEFLAVSPLDPELPEGQVPLRSAFYIERGTIESDCYKHITQPGSLIRIKAPRRMGKSSLMTRILHHAEEQGYRTVSLSLQSCVDKDSLHDIDKFLRHFCANVSSELKLPRNQLNDYWDDLLPSKMRCRVYFEEYLLAKIQQPIVIALDDVEELFKYEDLADDFFGLLRSWHEEAKNKTLWQKLRLVVAHSTAVYISLNSNQSPFNVGLPIELPEFTAEQVENLAERYGLFWSKDEVERLIGFVGGNPYLIRLALYQIWNNTVTLEQILHITPISEHNIYQEHLQRLLYNLQILNSGLVEVYSQVIMANEPIEIDPIQAFKLQSLGLIRFKGGLVTPSCQLYTQYFYDYFKNSFFLREKKQNKINRRDFRPAYLHTPFNNSLNAV